MRRSPRSSAGSAVATPRRPIRVRSGWRDRLGWIVVGLATLAALFYLTWSVFATLFTAAVFAYLMDPVVTWIAKRGTSRDLATILLGLVILVVTALLLVWVVPTVVRQIAELTTNIRPYIDNLASQLGPWLTKLEVQYGFDIPVDFGELRANLPEYLQRLSPDVRVRIQTWAQSLASGGLQVILTILSLSLLPLFTFYLLRDWPHLVAGADALVPPQWRAVVRPLATEIDLRLRGFVRGQVTVAFALGIIYTIGLLVAGIDLAVMVGMFSGVLFLVPYLGTLVGIVISSTLALLKFGLDWHVVVCIATYVIGQLLEGTFLTPWLVGDRVGLHPMVVMVALIVGGNLLGIWGLVLAVPITATLAVLAASLLARYRESRLYRA